MVQLEWTRWIPTLFYILLLFYFYSGLRVYSYDTKDPVHKTFFYMNLGLSTWSLMAVLITHVGTGQDALLWTFVSVFGWGFVYSFLSSHLIHLTGYAPKMNRKKWTLVYAPILISLSTTLYSFLSGEMEKRLRYGDYGWTYKVGGEPWTTWLKVYYFLMGFSALYMLYQWKPKPEMFIRGKYQKVISVTLKISLLLGLPKILGFYEYFGLGLLGLGPIHMLPAVGGLLYVLVSKARSEREVESFIPKRGEYLSAKTHDKIFFYVSQVYLLAAFLVFYVQVLLNVKEIIRTSFLSATLFFIGLFVFYLLKVKISVRTRDDIINSILSLSIPFVTLFFSEVSVGFAFAAPVILIFMAVAFNNKNLLIATSTMSVITLILLWIMYPQMAGSFRGPEHFARLLIFFIIIGIAFFINDIYRKRQQQFERQIDHERFLADMVQLMSKARYSNVKSNLEVFLEETVYYMEADYGSVHIFSDIKDGVHRKFEQYGRGDLAGIRKNLRFSSVLDHLLEDTTRAEHDEANIRRIIARFRAAMTEEKVALMIQPVVESEKVIGVMCLGSFDRNSWDEGYQNSFELIVKNLSSMLYKVKKEDELYRMAYYDALTGLPNRVMFSKILTDMLERSEEGEYTALLFLDLDDFKNINDLLGHSVGDQLLVEVVSRIKPKLYNDKHISRFGGDEFLVVLPNMKSVEEIETKVREILDTAIGTFQFDERLISTGASIGVSIYPKDGRQAEDLIRYADLAMYSAKNHGKNQYVLCTEDIKAKFVYEKEIENDLHYAITNKEFVLYYQPRVHGESLDIVGVEALLRWNHPEKGMIPPGVFIPIAERIGLMSEIDQWVFREACRQNLYWQRKGYKKINMSVNVTPMTFAGNFEGSDILKNLRERIWDPSYIEVEITENTMYFSPESIRNRLNYLRGMGMSVALDDFGIAYSSLGRLHELPIDKIKIDRQFVVNLNEAEKGKNLYDGILHLGRSLGLVINVEGVENEAQAAYVRSRGCDEIQGFYYYRPMPPEQVELHFKKERTQ